MIQSNIDILVAKKARFSSFCGEWVSSLSVCLWQRWEPSQRCREDELWRIKHWGRGSSAAIISVHISLKTLRYIHPSLHLSYSFFLFSFTPFQKVSSCEPFTPSLSPFHFLLYFVLKAIIATTVSKYKNIQTVRRGTLECVYTRGSVCKSPKGRHIKKTIYQKSITLKY